MVPFPMSMKLHYTCRVVRLEAGLKAPANKLGLLSLPGDFPCLSLSVSLDPQRISRPYLKRFRAGQLRLTPFK